MMSICFRDVTSFSVSAMASHTWRLKPCSVAVHGQLIKIGVLIILKGWNT